MPKITNGTLKMLNITNGMRIQNGFLPRMHCWLQAAAACLIESGNAKFVWHNIYNLFADKILIDAM